MGSAAAPGASGVGVVSKGVPLPYPGGRAYQNVDAYDEEEDDFDDEDEEDYEEELEGESEESEEEEEGVGATRRGRYGRERGSYRGGAGQESESVRGRQARGQQAPSRYQNQFTGELYEVTQQPLAPPASESEPGSVLPPLALGVPGVGGIAGVSEAPGKKGGLRQSGSQRSLGTSVEPLSPKQAMDNLGDYFMSRSKSGRRLEVKFGYWNEKGSSSDANVVEEDALVVCRICEEEVEAVKLQQHSHLCALANKCDSTAFSLDDRLRRLAEGLDRVASEYIERLGATSGTIAWREGRHGSEGGRGAPGMPRLGSKMGLLGGSSFGAGSVAGGGTASGTHTPHSPGSSVHGEELYSAQGSGNLQNLNFQNPNVQSLSLNTLSGNPGGSSGQGHPSTRMGPGPGAGVGVGATRGIRPLSPPLESALPMATAGMHLSGPSAGGSPGTSAAATGGPGVTVGAGGAAGIDGGVGGEMIGGGLGGSTSVTGSFVGAFRKEPPPRVEIPSSATSSLRRDEAAVMQAHLENTNMLQGSREGATVMQGQLEGASTLQGPGAGPGAGLEVGVVPGAVPGVYPGALSGVTDQGGVPGAEQGHLASSWGYVNAQLSSSGSQGTSSGKDKDVGTTQSPAGSLGLGFAQPKSLLLLKAAAGDDSGSGSFQTDTMSGGFASGGGSSALPSPEGSGRDGPGSGHLAQMLMGSSLHQHGTSSPASSIAGAIMASPSRPGEPSPNPEEIALVRVWLLVQVSLVSSQSGMFLTVVYCSTMCLLFGAKW